MSREMELRDVPIGDLGETVGRMHPESRFQLATALAEAVLKLDGWQAVVMPDGTRLLSNPQWSFNIDSQLGALASGGLSAASWQEACSVAGFASVTVPIWDEPRRTGLQRVRRTVLIAGAVAIAILAMAIGFDELEQEIVEDHTLHPKYLSPTKPVERAKLDGRSHLPGNAVAVSYSPRYDDGVLELEGDRVKGYDHGASWKLSWPFGKGAFATFELEQNYAFGNLDLPEERSRWLKTRRAQLDSDAGQQVNARKAKIGGQVGYEWELDDTAGRWRYTVAVPVVDHWYLFTCSTTGSTASSAVKRRCQKLVDSARFRDV